MGQQRYEDGGRVFVDHDGQVFTVHWFPHRQAPALLGPREERSTRPWPDTNVDERGEGARKRWRLIRAGRG